MDARPYTPQFSYHLTRTAAVSDFDCAKQESKRMRMLTEFVGCSAAQEFALIQRIQTVGPEKVRQAPMIESTTSFTSSAQ